ncbi:MAG: membrane protein insertase YidC [Henriciella sp.]|nr:membrane protein insertase YidC [Henriciella sp.]
MMQQRNGMDPQDQRNFIIAMALMIAFVFLYQVIVVNPEQAARRAAQEQAAANAGQQEALVERPEVSAPGTVVVDAETVTEALAQTERVAFDVQRVDGSLNLSGPLLDDLNLKDHYRTIEKEEELRLLRPKTRLDGEVSGYSADWTWSTLEPTSGQYFPVMAAEAGWTAASDELLPGGSITLTYERGGVQIERIVSVDENYMFSFADTLTNTRQSAITLSPVGYVRRYGEWKDFLEVTEPRSSRRMGIVHQGLIGAFDEALTWRSYNNIFKGRYIKKADDNGTRAAENGGWVGLTDMYWMAALVPQQERSFRAKLDRSEDALELTLDGEDITLQPGESQTITNRIFAGAKEYDIVNAYQAAGIPRFGDSIDWGNILYYMTKGLFWLLDWLKGVVGSFGLAILALTVLVKLPLVPLYNQSYKSMAKMKKLAEPMKELQERFKADPQRRQQEIMKLYQREKANPLAGCIPILFTIPIFFALYKTLYVTIEMRHTPFLFLSDLSAPDPTAIGNLFGLLPWAAADVKAIPLLGFIIGIGILPILYGVTMAGIQALSPPPPDPTQRTIMMALPFVFMFVFGGFAAGLVLYWVWSNILSLIQQYYIMRRNGVETELDKLVKRLLGRAEKPAE